MDSFDRSDSDSNEDNPNIKAVIEETLKNVLGISSDEEPTPTCGKPVQRLMRFVKPKSKFTKSAKSPTSSQIKQSGSKNSIKVSINVNVNCKSITLNNNKRADIAYNRTRQPPSDVKISPELRKTESVSTKEREDQLLNPTINTANFEVQLQSCMQCTDKRHVIGTSNTYFGVERYNENIIIEGHSFIQQTFSAQRPMQSQQCSSDFFVGSLSQLFNINNNDQFHNNYTQFPTDIRLINAEQTLSYDILRVLKPEHEFTGEQLSEVLDNIRQGKSNQVANLRTDIQNECTNQTCPKEDSAKDKQLQDIDNLYCEDNSRRINPVSYNASLIAGQSYDNSMTEVENKVEEVNNNEINTQNVKTNFTQAQIVSRKDENRDTKGSRQKVNCKVKGQTKHFIPRKSVYAITLQDKRLVESMSHDDTIRHAMHEFFNNDEKMHFSRPSVPIPSMHPLLPYKSRYLDEKSDTCDHNEETHVTRL